MSIYCFFCVNLTPTLSSPYAKGSGSGYEDCHGFEIELEGLSCTDVYYTFNYNRYGQPNVTDTGVGSCSIRYASGYDDVQGRWLLTTPIPSSLLQGGKIVPTNGHSCFSSGQADYATSGCEHFGISLGSGKNPVSTKYRWLIADAQNPGTGKLVPSTVRVGIPAVTWNVYQGMGVAGGNVVQAVIPAEPPEPDCGGCIKWGDAKWVKVYVTEKEHEVDLDHLLGGDADVPQESSETEIEWKLLQSPPTCEEETCAPVVLLGEDELKLEAEAKNASKSVVRR